MKRFAFVVPFLVISAVSAFIFLKDWQKSLFTCTADVEFTVRTNNSTIKLDGDYDFVIHKENNASINVSGTFYIDNEKHEVNRIYLLDYSKNKGDEFYTMKTVDKKVHRTDSTPTALYEKYFIAQGIGVPFYIKIRHLNNNLYLIEGLKRSYFTCIRQ
ncbi:hypothetical protein OR233_004433 [Enterobacter asburiae]|nr:hypothetical protein [Enterobacter asburiae]